MLSKLKEKERAIILRKEGRSYGEILKEIPVAKSTLSLWLKSVGLSILQKQRITEKRLEAARRGGLAKRFYREKITKEIKDEAKAEIGQISKNELWLMGIMLYWAEGSKEKANSVCVQFTNSDPQMIKLFLNWLYKICLFSKEDINCEIYLHENALNRERKVRNYWSEITGISLKQFHPTRWKKNKFNTKRKNIGKDYNGLLRITVKRSGNFNRKIAGWIEGICKNVL